MVMVMAMMVVMAIVLVIFSNQRPWKEEYQHKYDMLHYPVAQTEARTGSFLIIEMSQNLFVLQTKLYQACHIHR